jgi:hypothetical protein
MKWATTSSLQKLHSVDQARNEMEGYGSKRRLVFFFFDHIYVYTGTR